MPIQILEQYLPMRVTADGVPEATTSTYGVSVFAIYLCPVLLYTLNYICIPFLVIKLTFYENNYKFS